MERASATGGHGRVLADLVLRPEPTEVARSRHVVGAVLAHHGCDGAREAVELLVTELVANAVEHAAHEVRLQVLLDHDQLRVEVADDGEGRPAVQAPDPLVEGGRGLRIVQQLAVEWGVAVAAGRGKVVWAEHRCRGAEVLPSAGA